MSYGDWRLLRKMWNFAGFCPWSIRWVLRFQNFLWHTWTDQSVPVENSLLLLQALRKAGVNVEAHLYPMGPHGIALGTEETQGIDQKYLAPYCESWMGLAIRWISEQL